ncbi:MAG: discoidin domain-containing protein [Eubacteriales bacterium]
MKKILGSLSLIVATALLIVALPAFPALAEDSGMYLPSICIKNVTADCYAPGYEPWFAFDQNDGSFWHTPWNDDQQELALPFPHWIMAELEEAQTIDSLVYVPRAGEPGQRATEYEVWISPDSNPDHLVKVDDSTWDWESETAGTSSFPAQTAKLVKFVVKARDDGEEVNTCASAAEIRIHSTKKIEVPTFISTDAIETVSANAYQEGYEPELAFNDNAGDFWHTPWTGEIPSYPHWLMVEFKEAQTIDMLIYTPRSGVSSQFVTSYEVWVSPDSNPDNLVKVDDGTWEFGPFGRSTFESTEAKLVKFVIKGKLDGAVDKSNSAVAELDFCSTSIKSSEPSYVDNSDIKTVTASSYQSGYEPTRAFNNNIDDFWHTPWGGDMQPFPHWIMAEFKEPQLINELIYYPRSQAAAQFVTEYEVWISPDSNPDNLVKVDDGTWEVGSTGVSTFAPQMATLVKFVIKARADDSEGDTSVSVAELKFRIAKEETLTPNATTGYSFYYQERKGTSEGTVDLRVLCVIDAELLEKRSDCNITVTITAGEKTNEFSIPFDKVYRSILAQDTVYHAAENAYILGVVITDVPDSFDGQISVHWTNAD